MPIPAEINTGFKIEEELLWKEEIPVEEIPLEDLAHNLNILYLESIGTDDWNMSPRMLLENFEREIPHATKVNNADMSYPIELYFFKGQWIILDGVHRYTKAHLLKQQSIRVRRVSDEVMQRTKKSDIDYLRWQGIEV